jgi:single-strand DNA-binding protein
LCRRPTATGVAAPQRLLTRRFHLSKGQLIDIEGRLQTRQWDDDAGVRHWKTEVVIASLEMLSGRGKKEYAKEAQAVATAPDDEAHPTNGAPADPEEVLVAM